MGWQGWWKKVPFVVALAFLGKRDFLTASYITALDSLLRIHFPACSPRESDASAPRWGAVGVTKLTMIGRDMWLSAYANQNDDDKIHKS